MDGKTTSARVITTTIATHTTDHQSSPAPTIINRHTAHSFAIPIYTRVQCGPRRRAPARSSTATRAPEPGPELHYVHPLQLMGECQVSVIYGTFWARLLQANHTQVHDSYCSMSCMYVLTLAMLVEGSHRILDSRNMVLITGKAFTILGLVVKWSDLRIQRCTAMNAGSATGSPGARYIRVKNSDK